MASARQTRRAETRKQQQAAQPKLHPRSLARSIATANGFGKEWRKKVAALPRTGKKFLHPEKHEKRAEA